MRDGTGRDYFLQSGGTRLRVSPVFFDRLWFSMKTTTDWAETLVVARTLKMMGLHARGYHFEKRFSKDFQ
jgi:hypothetical protein